jgi:hypothetical protein
MGSADARNSKRAPELSPLEVAICRPLGLADDVEPIVVPRGPAPDPVSVIEDVLAEALSRQPCLLAFSGGRDSSALLALATKVSRERGLPVPVPVTQLFPGDRATEEDEWQALVVGHLGLRDWARVRVEPGQLDVVGPVATKALSRHGLYWPFNAHFHLPLIEQAAGGSIVTGIGGDELGLATNGAHAERIWARQERVSPLSAARVLGFALAPRWLREVVYKCRFDEELPWLTRLGYRQARRAIARDYAASPFGFDRVLQQLWCSRYAHVSRTSYAVLASPYDVEPCHPFADRRVLQALGATGGIPGFGSRAALMQRLFGDVLPVALVRRTSKATFTEQAFSTASADFARGWSGKGFDHGLVRPDWLRSAWLQPGRYPLTGSLLQSAWLHDDADGGDLAHSG